VFAVEGTAPPELEVEWTAPEGCPDSAEVTSRVSRLLGGVVKSKLTAVTDVMRTPGGYRARLRVTTPAGSGERVLDNSQCDILADSVAVVIALSASSSLDSLSVEDTQERDGRLAFAASAQGSALFGVLSQPALGLGGGIAVEGLSSLRLELRGAYYFQQSATFDRSPLGGTFGLATFGARACRVWSFGAWDLSPCAGVEAYFVTANGFGGEVSRREDVSWWGPALGAFGRLRLSKTLAVYLVADGVAPLTRRRFVFSDVGELHRPSAVALELLVAPEVRF
jgi:hypothetical protein